MNKYKVCVYAICKNEEKFVEEWFNSMKEADEIYVLDTGSTDNSVKMLEDLGVHVETKIITPWRFDVARNESLKLVSKDTDIYVCTDLDEIFLPGWRKELEDNWQDNIVQAKYRYNWALDKYGKPTLSFLCNKIHNSDFKWKYPIHEVLEYQNKNIKNVVILKNVTLNHYQDKNKNRSSYLPLLELAIKENPNDSRNIYLLTREYLRYNKWEQCIDLAKKYLEVDPNGYYAQRCSICRYAGRANRKQGNYKEAKIWYNKAIKAAPSLREGYIELGMLEFSLYNYGNAIELFEKALTIKENSLTVVNEIFAWDDTVYRLLSEAYHYTKRYTKAIEYINLALEINPDSAKNIQIKNEIERITNQNN